MGTDAVGTRSEHGTADDQRSLSNPARKPSFKHALQNRRCLIPANGFYEWVREGKRKIPMWIQLKTRKPLPFLGCGIAG